MVSQLIGSSFANGALLPNYVNGRLLAAEDLATGQSTLLQRDTMTGCKGRHALNIGIERDAVDDQRGGRYRAQRRKIGS